MLKIRFKRIGKKKQPSFRIIISEKSRDTKGKFLENLGYYNPKSKGKKLDRERIKYWLEKGVQVSDTLHNLLVEEKIISKPKIKIAKIKKKEEKPKEEKTSEEKSLKKKEEEKEKEIKKK